MTNRDSAVLMKSKLGDLLKTIPNATPNQTDNLHMSLAQCADIFQCYERAVQDTKNEVRNLVNIYSELISENDNTIIPEQRVPLILQEDFCGTAALCRQWVQGDPCRSAIAIDIDPTVLLYARKKNAELGLERLIDVIEGDVSYTAAKAQAPNILVAFNYGISYFHSYSDLVRYFRRCRSCLAENGVLFCDLFNVRCVQNMVRKDFDSFQYIFEQNPTNLMDNTFRCSISFKFPDRSSIRKAFCYHFRAWTIAEVKEAMSLAGFQKVVVYVCYEHDTRTTFIRVLDKLMECSEAWHAYIVGQ